MYPDHLSYMVGSGPIIERLRSIPICITLPKLVDNEFVKDLSNKDWTHLIFPRCIDSNHVIGWIQIPEDATHFVFPKQFNNPCYLIGKNLNNRLGMRTKINHPAETPNGGYVVVYGVKIPLDELVYHVVELY